MEDAGSIHTLFKAQTGNLSSFLCLGAVWTLPLGVLVRVQEEGEEMVGHRKRRGFNIIYSLLSVSLDISLRCAQETLWVNVFVFSCVCVMFFSGDFLINDASLVRRKPTIHWINSLSGWTVHAWKDHLRQQVLGCFVQQVQGIACAGVEVKYIIFVNQK